MAGLITYVVGALVFHRYLWIATTISVATMLLLQMKDALEGLTRRIAPDDIFTFTKFLLLSAVVLPVLPNEQFTPFHINPFKTWLVVVAVSSVSYASLRAATLDPGRRRHHSGVAAGRRLLLDRDDGRAGEEGVGRAPTIPLCGRHPDGVRDDVPAAGCAAGDLQQGSDLRLAPAFIALAAVAIGAGWFWLRRSGPLSATGGQEPAPANPLELGAAFAVRAALPGDAGGHPARDPVPRRRGRLLAGCQSWASQTSIRSSWA